MLQWDRVPLDQCLGFPPWVWSEFESSEPPGPFPFLGGVDQRVVACLHEVHQRLSGAIDIAISDVFAGRTAVRDQQVSRRLENAYAEVVQSRPHLREVITCGRWPDGTFEWRFPLDPTQSASLQYTGLRVFNAETKQMLPFGVAPVLAPMVGRFLGCLDGTRTAGEIQAEIRRARESHGQALAQCLTSLMDGLSSHGYLVVTQRSLVRAHWLDATHDRDMVHLGHAALMYRQRDQFFLFDPWLIPWYAEAPIPSYWTTVLPKPSAIFLTHDHDDHVDPRTLLAFPKETPVIVPSRKNRRALFYDYRALLGGLGFMRIIELAHGDTWTFDGGGVVSVPFYGECSCELGLPRNCYLIADRGRNVLVHVDSGPTNSRESMVKDGVIDDLVRRYGPIDTVYAQPGQLLELRTFAAYACLSHPGRWLEVGENCCVSSDYLAELVASAEARLLVAYANGGADWLPDHPVFVFNERNQALREMVTAHWWPLGALSEKLEGQGCRMHQSHALDLFCELPDGTTKPLPSVAPLPLDLYRLDHSYPSLPQGSRSFGVLSPG